MALPTPPSPKPGTGDKVQHGARGTRDKHEPSQAKKDTPQVRKGCLRLWRTEPLLLSWGKGRFFYTRRTPSDRLGFPKYTTQDPFPEDSSRCKHEAGSGTSVGPRCAEKP